MLFFAIVYTVEGFCQAKVGVIWQPLTHYLKESQGWDPVQIAASLAVLDVPWVVKPLYGMVSDFLPLFGYRRRSYLLLANVGAVAAFLWTTQVLAPAPIVFALLLTAIAMATSSTVCGALLVENGQKHRASAAFINQQWLWFNVAVMAASLLGGELIESCRRRAPCTPLRRSPPSHRSAIVVSCSRWSTKQRAGINVAEFRRALRGFLDTLPLAHAVADRGLPVLLLFQPRLRHAALFPHDRPPALLAGHDRPAVIGQRRRMDRGRTDLPLPAARHGNTRAAQPQHPGRHAGDAGISRHGR